MSIKEVLNNKKNNKFHLKFLVVSTICIALLSFGIYYAYSDKYVYALKLVQEQKEKMVVQQLTNLIEHDFVNNNNQINKLEIEKIAKGAGIHYILVTNSSDSTLVKFYFDDFGHVNDIASSEPAYVYDPNDVSLVRKAIEVSNSQKLNLFCEFSKAELNSKILKSKIEIGSVSLLVFTISCLVLFAASLIIMVPLQRISNSVMEISSGNLTRRIVNENKDEFSNIAVSVNSLADNLHRANNQIEKLNKELKYQFRDKIGELNYEINQRRHAEFSLKQSEEQFKLLFELAPIGMVISTIHGKILKVNAAFHSALGYSEVEILDKKIKDLTFVEDRAIDIKIHEQLIDGSQQSSYYEKRMLRKDGQVIYVIVEAVLVKNKEGKPSHIIEQVIDISERKRVERELIVSKEKAEESDRLKSAFLAQMSHEIRTPLNVILTAMNLIQDDLNTADEDTKVILDSVSSAGKRLQRTIDLILNISAVQSGSYSQEFKDFDLDFELMSLLDEFKTTAKEKGLRLSYTNKTKNSEILADHYSVTQIFQNLFDNAIKYTLKGSVEVILDEWNKEKLQVVVRDTGIGISKQYITDLFSPFSQEDVGHKREFEGNGLGLALVKKYVEINNADILVESVKDKGSIFTVIFNKKSADANGFNKQSSIKSDNLKEFV